MRSIVGLALLSVCAACGVTGAGLDGGADDGLAFDSAIDSGSSGGGSATPDASIADAGARADAGTPPSGSGSDAGPRECGTLGIVHVFDAGSVAGGVPFCPSSTADWSQLSCGNYCSCWFKNCAPMPRYNCVLSGWDECMTACARFSRGEFACRGYRVINNPLSRHCAEARPGAKCP